MGPSELPHQHRATLRCRHNLSWDPTESHLGQQLPGAQKSIARSTRHLQTAQRLLAALEAGTSRQLVVVTLASLQGYEISDYGYQLGRAWGIGQKKLNNGVLFIIAPKERATRIEVGVSLPELLAGRVSPTRVRLRGGKLWCPASVARGGVRRPLIDTLTLDVTKEGRWLNLRSIQARGGKITCHLAGVVPTGLLRDSDAPAAAVPLVRRLAETFAAIETAVDVAERSGGASVSLRCQGNSDGTAELAGLAVLGNDWSADGLGLIQVRGLNLRGHVKLSADGRVREWRLDGGAQALSSARSACQGRVASVTPGPPAGVRSRRRRLFLCRLARRFAGRFAQRRREHLSVPHAPVD